MSTETQRDSFLCLKIQVSKAVSTVDRFTRQKWALVVKYSKRAELEVRNYCYSFSFCFLSHISNLGISADESACIFCAKTFVGWEALIIRWSSGWGLDKSTVNSNNLFWISGHRTSSGSAWHITFTQHPLVSSVSHICNASFSQEWKNC